MTESLPTQRTARLPQKSGVEEVPTNRHIHEPKKEPMPKAQYSMPTASYWVSRLRIVRTPKEGSGGMLRRGGGGGSAFGMATGAGGGGAGGGGALPASGGGVVAEAGALAGANPFDKSFSSSRGEVLPSRL